MIAHKRKQHILSQLAQKKIVMVGDLSREMGVTEETVRRDLEKLEAEGSLSRVHGGAYLREGYANETSVAVRAQIFQQQKAAIARSCMQFIQEKDTIFLDCSTTASYIAKELVRGDKKLSVITNSLSSATLLAGADHLRLVMLGGELCASTASFCGAVTEQSLNHYYADKAFISSAGISLLAGVADYTQEEAAIRKKMMQRAGQCFFVGDNTKIGRQAMYSVAPLQQLHRIITDQLVHQTNQALQQELQRLKIQVTVAPPLAAGATF